MKKPVFKLKQQQHGFNFIFTVPGETSEGFSESYASKEMTTNGIDSVKENCIDDKNYELKVAKNGQLYFVLHAKNGEIIYKSVMHNSEASRENSILMLKQFGPEAEVIFVPYEDHD